jgi:hypothetical protein
MAEGPVRTSRSFGARGRRSAHRKGMTTAEQQRNDLAESELFDWRFTALTRAGYPHADAWLLAAAKDVDLRAAERLLAQGCPPATAVRILL